MEGFDLFKLHDPDEDKDPKWSWIRGSGKELNGYVRFLMKELSGEYGTNNIVKKINKELPELSEATIADYFWSPNMKRYPLVFLDTLSKQFENCEETKGGIQNRIEILSISRWDSKPIKAVKKLDITICKIAGAHAADGSLWGEYNIELIDGNKPSVEQFAKWIDEVFGYTTEVKKKHGENAHHVLFKSRIIGRYLNKFLEFPIGGKSKTVSEPSIIKKSNIEFRRAFALGVMTFDGSVTMRGEAMINLRSKQLIYDLVEIVKDECIDHNVIEDGEGKFTLQFRRKDDKLLNYFETKSWKYQRLYELISGHRGKTSDIEYAKESFDLAYPRRLNSATCFSELIDLICIMKSFSLKELSAILSWFGDPITRVSLGQYIEILRKNNIVKLVKIVGRGHMKVFKFNEDISEWRVPIRT